MGKARYAWVTMLPLAWLTIVTMTAGWEKLFSPDAKLGFLSHAHLIEGQVAANALPAAIKTLADARRVIFNDYLDAAVAAFFMVSVVVILADSVREWAAVLGGRKPVVSSEVPFDARVAVVGD
jgi:carbon starvation protein